MRIVETYEPIEVSHTLRLKCRGGCGRTVQRTEKASQTQNPFNKDENGNVKSIYQIRQENSARLAAQVEQTKREGLLCRHCEEETK